MSHFFFSTAYSEARLRFRTAASDLGAELFAYPITIDNSADDQFSIDVAILGNPDLPTIVSSSGVHGVEGFMGSAIQLAILDNFKSLGIENVRHVLVHGVNPIGFEWLRRFNEENVDLNRNFVAEGPGFRGASDHYVRLNPFLNPESPPKRFEFFTMQALAQIARFGLGPLKQGIAQGQYDYPRGIFYGGDRLSQSTKIITDHCDRWLSNSPRVIHFDFHSGLGSFGKYKLLLPQPTDSQLQWYQSVFGSGAVELSDQMSGTAYESKGSMGAWLQQHFADTIYRFATVEYGTYGPLRVLAAIRAENRAHHFSDPHSVAYEQAKAELLECFCPANSAWRTGVVNSGIQLVKTACRSLSHQ